MGESDREYAARLKRAEIKFISNENGQNCTIVERALEIEAQEESVVFLPPMTRTNLTIYTYTLYTHKLNSFALVTVFLEYISNILFSLSRTYITFVLNLLTLFFNLIVQRPSLCLILSPFLCLLARSLSN